MSNLDKLIQTRGVSFTKRYLAETNARHGNEFVEIPTDDGPDHLIKTMRNRKYLVQVYARPEHPLRLTISRTQIDRKGNYLEITSWQELQDVKDACGYAEFDAAEVYPKQKNIVDHANMRHLWIFEYIPWAWDASGASRMRGQK